MRAKILVADSDRKILRVAFETLRDQGFRVIAETAPAEVLRMARQWRPDLIIAPASCLRIWDIDPAEGLDTVLPEFSFLVTANSPEELTPWERWIGRYCEILIKPVVHPMELVAAVEDAMAASKQPPPRQPLPRPADQPGR